LPSDILPNTDRVAVVAPAASLPTEMQAKAAITESHRVIGISLLI
jgi:hypothetical protein